MDERVEEEDRISNLPEEILYNILYFMSKKDAAQTCVLSKSWRFLWQNRLTISYSEGSPLFSGPHRTRLFINALQSRLSKDNHHRIEEFHLNVNSSDSASLLENWIPMLKSIGVKAFFLSIDLHAPDSSSSYFHLPSVFFHAESLTSLRLVRCKFPQYDRIVHFHRLELICLRNVEFTDQHTINNIIWTCPLITSIRLEECKGLHFTSIDLFLKHLKHFTFINKQIEDEVCGIDILSVPTIETIYIHGSSTRFRFHGHKFTYLKELSLNLVIVSTDSFDFSSCYEFPLLESFDITGPGWDDINLRMNAPKILHFKCLGYNRIPSISFTTPMSRQCRSVLGFRFRPESNSFLELSGFLHAFGQSRICLSVFLDPMPNILNIEQDVIDNIDGVDVEELGLDMAHAASFPTFLDCMFSVCRPRNIVQHSYVREAHIERDQKELTEFLCNFLTMKSWEFTRKEDLEEVRIESFDADNQQWEPVLLSECALLPKSKNRVRFQLKWSEDANRDEESSSSKRRKLE
ncbi:hypothetical protein ACP275_09G115200 [Erythranthe tilingii]